MAHKWKWINMSGIQQSFGFMRSAGVTFMVASTSGATVVTSGNYKIASFNGTGSFVVSSVGAGDSESNTIQYLVVAGGGAGGVNLNGGAGGGGAGGMLVSSGTVVTAISYTVTIGAGGAGATLTNAVTSGTASSIGSLVSATGGGYGGGYAGVAASGGSGGVYP